MKSIAATSLLMIFLAAPALADVVVTKTGKVVKGKILGEENGKIKVATPAGQVVINRANVRKVEGATELAKLMGLQLKLIADTDADGFFRLSRWCSDKGLFEKEQEILGWVIAIDFDHEKARKALGYIRDRSGAWIKVKREGGATDGADFKKALRYFRDGKDDKAEKLLRKIVEATPGCLEALYLLGEIYISAEQYGKAEETFTAMMKVDQRAVLAHYGMGNLRLVQKKLSSALTSANMALELAGRIADTLERKSMQAEVYYLLGRIRLGQGEASYNEAEADFLRCTLLNRKHYRAWAELGGLYGHKGIVKKANDAFAKSLASNSRYRRARYNWGVLLYRSGELQKAAHKLYPLTTGSRPYLPSLLIYGRCYHRSGKNGQAKKLYQRYIKLGGDDARAQEWLKEVE